MSIQHLCAVPQLTFIVCISLFGYAALSGAGTNSVDASASHINFSAPVTAAMTGGWAKAIQLREHAVSAPVEIAPQAMQAWAEVRWQAFGISPTGTLFGADAAVALAAWEAIVAERGASAIAVALTLSETAGFRSRATRFTSVILTAIPAIDVARWIAAHATLHDLQRLIRLLIESTERSNDPLLSRRVVEVLLLLWRYDDSVTVAEQAFVQSGDDAFVNLAATAIRRSGTDEALGTALNRLHRGRSDRAGRERELVFWIRVAAQLRRPEPLRGRLRPSDLQRLTAVDAAQVVQNLVQMGLLDTASELLSTAQSPFQIYLRAWVRRQAGHTSTADEDLAIFEAALEDKGVLFEGEALAAADVMDRLGDTTAAIRLWTRIINSKPTDTLYDLNAHLRLARVAESNGDLMGALAHCEAALRISGELATASLTGPGGQRGTEWLMRTILELRRRVGRGTTINSP